MKDTHRYVIETANLDTALKEFAQMNQGISINRTDNDNEIRLDITDGSRKGILHLYHKNGILSRFQKQFYCKRLKRIFETP